MDLPEDAELAIIAYEKLADAHVSIHDRSRFLWPFLPTERFEHLNPLCRGVKALRQAACTAFEVDALQPALARRPDGLVKRCHAGLVEWVVPVAEDGALAWVLFAGLRRPGPRLSRLLTDGSPLPRAGAWSPAVARLPPVDDQEAAWLLEGLRQLAARLRLWRQAMGQQPAADRAPLPRRQEILAWIRVHHREPLGLDDLARHLGISPARIGHAVAEACDRPFLALLHEARLRTAAGLLRHTDLPLPAVAEQSGFANLAHFHRLFRRAHGCTPHRWRRTAERPLSPA